MKPRSWTIRPRDADRPLVEVVAGILRAPRSRAESAIVAGGVRVDGKVCRRPGYSVRPGQRVTMSAEERSEPRREKRRRPSPANQGDGVKIRLAIVYQDDSILVVFKPAGVTTVRHSDEVADAGSKARFLPPTLIDLLPGSVKGPTHGRFRLRAVHRLDRETSGLVVVARTPEAESHLGKQFRQHSIERRYLALIRCPTADLARNATIESHLVRDRGDGRRGSGAAGDGQHAVTHVRVLEAFARGALVECTLDTGRTHQVRIHLGEQGTPLCGERIYDRPCHGVPVADDSGADRPMLHAAFLAIDHPKTGRRLSWTAEPPDDFQQCQERLSKAR